MFNSREMSNILYNCSITCRKCKIAKPSNDYYESCLLRNVFYCKPCHNMATELSRKKSLSTIEARRNRQNLHHACATLALRLDVNTAETRKLLRFWSQHDENYKYIMLWQRPIGADVQVFDVVVVSKETYKKMRSIPIESRKYSLPIEQANEIEELRKKYCGYQ